MKKRVLLIVPTLANGGAERIVSYLSTGLPSGWQVDLLLREKKLDYDVRPDARVMVTGGGLRGIFATYRVLRRAKKRGDYDIYNSHMASSNMLNLFSGKKSGKRVLTIHAVTSMQMREQRLGGIVNFIIRHFYHKADRIVAVSGAVRDDLMRAYGIDGARIAAIENGNDIARVKALCEQPLSSADAALFETRPVITAMGRYAPAKGHLSLIRAFHGVVQCYPTAKLLLIGEGELRGAYERLISELKLEGNVVLTGYRKNPFQLIRSSDLFVFSSVYEGYGCALAEAMFCHTAVIAVDCPGVVGGMLGYDGVCHEPVYLDSGTICPALRGADADNTAAEQKLCGAMLFVLADRDYAAGCAAYNLSRESEFSVEAMLSKWTAMLESL